MLAENARLFYLEKSGAIKEMRKLGIEDGDTIRLYDYEFEYEDEF